MKKIMFNDTCELTKLVLTGKKTMTRRAIPPYIILDYNVDYNIDTIDINYFILKHSRYHLGEKVAIAQSYRECGFTQLQQHQGWKNKMFTKPTLLPHLLQITEIKVERLQDIKTAEIRQEGVNFDEILGMYQVGTKYFERAKEAFEYLIDQVSGKGTWQTNPYVFAYSFKLIQ